MMERVDGRTRAQWRAYDRWHALVAAMLAAGLVVLWQGGHGPGDASCCGATVTAASAPVAAVPVPPEPVVAAPPVETSTPAVATSAPPPAAEAALAAAAPTAAQDAAAPQTVASSGAPCDRALDSDLSFATGSSDLRPAGKRQLDLLLPCLAGKRIAVTGHSDSVGDAATNRRLAQARAVAVVNYLASRGADRALMSARGVGAAMPIADNATEVGRRANRRVDIAVSP